MCSDTTLLAKMILTDDKTRLSAGSVLMLRKLLDAVNRSPAFDGFVFPRFPVDQFRRNLEAGFKLKVERGLVLKHNFDDVVIG